jgi:hypothetical protein
MAEGRKLVSAYRNQTAKGNSTLRKISANKQFMRASAMEVKDDLGHSHVIAVAKAVIKAPVLLVMAYGMCNCRYNAENYWVIKNEEDPVVLEERVVERTPLSVTQVARFAFPFPFRNRESVYMAVWAKAEQGEDFDYIISGASCDHPDVEANSSFVRMKLARAMTLTQLSPTTTAIDIITYAELGGNIPKGINNAITVPQVTSTPVNMMNFFASVRSPAAYKGDASANNSNGYARELGLLVTHQHNGSLKDADLRLTLERRITQVALLRDLRHNKEWIDELLFHLVRNKISKESKKGIVESSAKSSTQSSAKSSTKSSTKSSASSIGVAAKSKIVLKEMTRDDARKVARGFCLLVMSNITAESAIDEWFHVNPALLELEAESPWFREFAVGVALDIYSRSSFGTKFRSILGASMSIMDILSDVWIIVQYFRDGRTGYACVLLGFVTAAIVAQLAISIIQTQNMKKERWKTFAIEACYILTFVKPGVDAFRVSNQVERREGQVVDSLDEMALMKASEVSFEAIPGLVIQAIAFMTSKQRSRRYIASMLISAASAGMISGSITFDLDTDPSRRKKERGVFGFVPNASRGTAATALILMASIQVLAKAVGSALLFVTNPWWLLWYMAGTNFLFHSFKLATRDYFTHPAFPPAAQLVLSCYLRTVLKLMADFCAPFKFRAQVDFGGLYFTFNLIENMAGVPVCAFLYNKYYEAEKEEDGTDLKLGPEVTVGFGLVCMVAFLVIFVYFIAEICVPEYRSSFWSMQTGNDYICSIFRDNEDDDEVRFSLFEMSAAKWAPVRNDVREWSHANWAKWQRDKPAWFSDATISMVPDDYIPKSGPGGLTELGANRARRTSASFLIAGERGGAGRVDLEDMEAAAHASY